MHLWFLEQGHSHCAEPGLPGSGPLPSRSSLTCMGQLPSALTACPAPLASQVAPLPSQHLFSFILSQLPPSTEASPGGIAGHIFWGLSHCHPQPHWSTSACTLTQSHAHPRAHSHTYTLTHSTPAHRRTLAHTSSHTCAPYNSWQIEATFGSR